jgi:hypothetical protein
MFGVRQLELHVLGLIAGAGVVTARSKSRNFRSYSLFLPVYASDRNATQALALIVADQELAMADSAHAFAIQ